MLPGTRTSLTFVFTRSTLFADGLAPPCTQVPLAVPLVAMRSERISEKVEPLRPGVPQRGLHLIECQPELRHHRLCPCQSLRRIPLAEDDEVIGIVDDVRTERLAAAAASPMLEEAVHVDVGKQRARDTALRSAAFAGLAPTRAPLPLAIPLLDRRLQPQLDQPQHVPVGDPAGHRLQEVRV